MGEVYRATDTNLKRQVAIKVLPAAVADNADRLARFQREAQLLLAALSHPNIAIVHGLEKGAAVTALVKGEPLTSLPPGGTDTRCRTNPPNRLPPRASR